MLNRTPLAILSGNITIEQFLCIPCSRKFNSQADLDAHIRSSKAFTHFTVPTKTITAKTKTRAAPMHCAYCQNTATTEVAQSDSPPEEVVLDSSQETVLQTQEVLDQEYQQNN
ncbi:hypothetical protein BZA05DRAFT_446641 [Tricharina praecox]|uniref:uncharacterized protein n=1 Tax=Tricharina praecox TaxID=43433 RepID=UPI00221F3052|nr:uncharacterized protein BZA05DRAFT_446641 [Tricharina praecox]KAI5848349.1 hypothetical protein BZA05DRAFT_446641 [Tricharina praecox]